MSHIQDDPNKAEKKKAFLNKLSSHTRDLEEKEKKNAKITGV